MPALPDVPGVLKIALKYGLSNGTDAIVRWFLGYSGVAPSDSELATFAGSVASAWVTNLAGIHTPDKTLTDVEIIDLTSPTSAAGAWSGADAGTDSGESLGPQVALVEKREIGRRYRGGHCRSYWPIGNVEATVGEHSSIWTPAAIGVFEGHLHDFRTDYETDLWAGASGVSDVNVSYYHGFTNVLYPSGRYHAVPTRRVDPIVDVIESYGINPKVGTQRRRAFQSL